MNSNSESPGPRRHRGLRGWTVVHRWSSLVCTAFLLLLCATGLPLIFHDEIDSLASSRPALAGPTDAPQLPLDTVLAAALADRPGHAALFMSFDEDRPVANVTTAPSAGAAHDAMTLRAFDLRTGRLVETVSDDGVMHWLLELHTDLFLGTPGKLLLGGMGVLFVVALVSGVVVYAPFMRRLPFGTVRASSRPRTRWLDWHNLLGITALAWMTVVGVTGAINAFDGPIVGHWRETTLASLTAPYRGEPAADPARLAPLDAAVRTARRAVPGARVQFVAFPGGAWSTPHHYAVFLSGATPLTKRLLTPVLVDARDGRLTAVAPMPWFMTALQLSQPLHFGDYGGLPLKLAWGALTLVTMIVLGSGLYLYAAKRVRAPRAAPALALAPAE